MDIAGAGTAVTQLIWARGNNDSAFVSSLRTGDAGASAYQSTIGVDYATYTDFARIKFYRASTTGEIHFFTGGLSANGTEKMRLDSSGNLLVGTTSAISSCKVSIFHSGNSQQLALSGASQTGIQFKNLTSGDGWIIGRSLSGSNSNDFFIFDHVNSATRFFIDTTGNVGIGTASPAAKLHVINSTPNSGRPTLFLDTNYGNTGDSSTGLRVTLNNNAGGGYISAYTSEFQLTHNAEYIAGAGFTARSTTASQLYQTAGEFVFYSNQGLTANNTFTFTERMRINSNGVVTMPTQTMISARHNTTETPSAGTPLLQWTIDVNQGGGSWNAGTGVYTVPVAGRYFVTCSLLRNTGGAAGGIQLHKNGVSVTRLFYVDNTGTTAYAPGSGQLIVNCGAGDTLKFINENTVAWYGDGPGLGSFTINLLG